MSLWKENDCANPWTTSRGLIVFIAHIGGGNELITAKNPDAAEIVFMRCGLTPERAVVLRAELERNEVVSVQTSIDDAVAAKFRYAKP